MDRSRQFSETPIATGVRPSQEYNDVEHARRGSRKQSVVAAFKDNYGLTSKEKETAAARADNSDGSDVSVKIGDDFTHRKLKPRHIQLIGIGGTIGTALYVQIGRGLLNGGPGSLFIAFTFWCTCELHPYLLVAKKLTPNASHPRCYNVYGRNDQLHTHFLAVHPIRWSLCR